MIKEYFHQDTINSISWMYAMVEKSNSSSEKLIGFFPLFYNLAETGRAVLIAKEVQKQGYNIVFFSHGGKYEYLVKQLNADIIHVPPSYSDEFIDLLWKSSRLETLKNPFTTENLRIHVEEEKEAFLKAGVDLIVSTNNWPCRISAPVARIPLIFVTPKVVACFSTFPEDAEFFLSWLLPERLKLIFLNWYAPRSKMYVKSFAKVAKQFHVSPPRYTSDINHGDYTFYTNSVELIGEKNIDDSADEWFIGPISLEPLFQSSDDAKSKQEQKEIELHIQSKKRSILVTLGSSGTKELFLKIIHALEETEYQVVGIYSNILDENNLPVTKDNILLKKFVLSIARINKMVDLAVTHGGEGTVLTAAYSGRPVIGFPMQFEQHLNLEMLVKHGSALIVSKRNLTERKIISLVEKIFSDYEVYYDQAQKIASLLPSANGHKNAALLIDEFLTKGLLNKN